MTRAGEGTVVIGVGSPLMADDGLGLVALERLRAGWAFEPHVELLDGGTWGMKLLPAIESANRLLLLDAIRSGAAPGRLVRLERDALPRFFATKLSPHQIDLKEVLALAELRGTLPAETLALGLEPGKVEMSAELGDAVTEGLPALVEAVLDQLRSWGHQVTLAASGGGRARP